MHLPSFSMVMADGQLPDLHPNAVREWMEILFWIVGGIVGVLTVLVLIRTLMRRPGDGSKIHVSNQPLLIKEAKEVATKEDLDALALALEERWNKRFESHATNTERELHRMASALQGIATAGHLERESIHLRINPLAEATADVRGKMELLLTHLIPDAKS